MDNIVKVNNISFEYITDEAKLKAIDNLSLDVKKGEFVAIIGHNGSGKSTLSKNLNAILMPTEGNILIDDMDTKEEERLWDIRQTAGMVFQNPDNQIVATIVEEDVAFGPENLGIEPKEIRRIVEESLKSVGMYDLRDRQPHLLSGGQKQRVAIAGIIAMRPKCIIFDEATAMLDPSGRKEVMKTIKRLNKEENITVIHITHFMEEAVEADRVVVMEKGKKILEGTPREVFSKIKMLKEIGLDVPCMTELSSLLIEEGINISSDILTVDEMVMELFNYSKEFNTYI
ncbi:ABC transporter family protein [Clostridioides difficile Y247]|uniref:energy-coupling factor transporter ATPase n=1 Tax=Clostridioides difficile TaxID=1496 RepID=UPI00038D4C83|nr:energy-coupling factor transporter ATPase [Clostridioides difficile]EQI48880.1 ABC transporter family protein [Clostridioides difficile Y247]